MALTVSVSLAMVLLLRPAAATPPDAADESLSLTAAASAIDPEAPASTLPSVEQRGLDVASLSPPPDAVESTTTTSSTTTTPAPTTTSTVATSTTEVVAPSPTSTVTSSTTTTAEAPPDPAPTEDEAESAPSTTGPRDALDGRVVTIHGDSLTVAAERELRQALAPAAVEIDAEVGRGLLGAAPRIASAARSGLVDVVVIALGTNDWGAPDGYEELVAGTLEALSEVRCVVWVTPQDFREGHATVIDVIRRQTDRFERAVVADWSVVAGPADLHADDGFHLSVLGRERFALLVAGTVRQCAGTPVSAAGLEAGAVVP